MNKHQIIMLYSGGADSRLMLELAIELGKNPYCILVDYEQKHIEELDYAIQHLKGLDIAYQIIKIKGLDLNSGLTGDLTESRWENVHAMNVPARNSWFLTLAAGIAESMNIQKIWIGCDMSDYYDGFPDCKQEYIGQINELFKIAFTMPIDVEAPLLGMKKEMISDMLDIFGILSKDVYSGYTQPKKDEVIREGYSDNDKHQWS